jgi:hypothetical protein
MRKIWDLFKYKENFFVLTEVKLLGLIVSKFGIMIDPKRTKGISQIPFPHNKKNILLKYLNIYMI